MNKKDFYCLEDIQQYYDERANTYIFKENNVYLDLVVFNFDLDVKANIDANNIKAKDIKTWEINVYYINANDIDASNIIANDIIAKDINAYDINAENIEAKDIDACDIKADSIDANNIIAHDIIAHDIYAKDISYWAVCSAYYNITCNSIKGRRKNAKHFVLDGKLEVIEDDKRI